MGDLIGPVLGLCVLLASAETLHGIFRAVVLVPRIGKLRAQQLSIVTGSLLAGALCAWRVPNLGLQGTPELLALGLVLSGFMAGFDIALARGLLHRRWPQVWQDFNPASGNYLLFGLIWLAGVPWGVMRVMAWLGR